MINLTPKLLDNLEDRIKIKTITSEDEFFEIINKDKVILYLCVDWSAPEMHSRYMVYNAIELLKQKVDYIYKLDCSDQSKTYIEQWLANQRAKLSGFYTSGNGETLLIKEGKVIEFIQYPFQIGIDGITETLNNWVNK